MGISKNILNYLSVYGKEDKYKLARKLKADVAEITNALDFLQQEGTIEIKEGKAVLAKGKKPIIAKAGKQEILPTKEPKEEKPKEEATEKKPEEQPTEVSEEAPTHEEIQKTFRQKAEEEIKGRIEGAVKFFNPNKGFGFITGDDGKEYYVHGSGLKEGITIEANDRVSFKVIQDPKGPKAGEVENLTQSGEQFRRTDQEHDQNVA